jgi:SAM-dependent methyltransferase
MDYDCVLAVEHCRLPDVVHLGGGVYDLIAFPKLPPKGILRRAIEKVYWGGYVVIFGFDGVVEEAGYEVIKGNPGMVVLRRPPLPDVWSEAYYQILPKGGGEWDPVSKNMHSRYRSNFDAIGIDWAAATVIEYGCGRGEITRLIALAGAERVYALDKAPPAIAMATRFCSDLQNVELACADALQWDSPEQVDIIVALDFVEHIEESDLSGLWKQMHRNLKAGGLVHIVTPLGPDAVRDHKWAPSPKLLKEKMEAAGFKYKQHVRPEGSRKFRAEFVK